MLEYISNEMQKKINVLYLIKLFCLNSLKMKFNDDKLNKLCPEIMNNLELSIGFDSVDFMEY